MPETTRTVSVMNRTVALTLALVLIGCSNTSDEGASGTLHNDADAAFLPEMIPHHEQAVMMAEMVSSDVVSVGIAELAAEIRATQISETERMRSWMTEWDVESDPHAGHSGSPHQGHGMMSPDELAALSAATGTDFERLWLSMMIEHHEGAITMARTVIEDGTNRLVRGLAEGIIASQAAEIERMTALLADR